MSHHSGPHLAAKSLKLVRRAGKSQGSRAKLVKLSGAGAAQALSSGPVVLALVQLHMEASAELAKISAPRNLAEWKKRCAKVVEVLAKLLKQKPTAYRVLWVARTWLKARMAGAGVRRLSVGRTRLKDMLQSWPDCKGHLVRLGEGQRYVQWLFDKLGYDGPAECFTMWCCLFNDKEVRKILRAKPESWLRDNLQTLRAATAGMQGG